MLLLIHEYHGKKIINNCYTLNRKQLISNLCYTIVDLCAAFLINKKKNYKMFNNKNNFKVLKIFFYYF